jgi:hypothetical protein
MVELNRAAAVGPGDLVTVLSLEMKAHKIRMWQRQVQQQQGLPPNTTTANQ